jgi:glycosyltransferase involved in cell wall biosynthesis
MGQTPKRPRVSIGIPIYRGESYLEETLKCLLGQTYTDYEIIIADNDPGGDAERIAEEYSKRYDFVHYKKHSKNIGALQNWNSLINHASGEYFICAGAHDLLSENALERMVNTLDHHQSVAIAYAPTHHISAEGIPFERNIGLLDTSGSHIVQRFNQVMWGNQEPLYGLMRMDFIRGTRLQKEIVGSGAVWLAEMAIFGGSTGDHRTGRNSSGGIISRCFQKSVSGSFLTGEFLFITSWHVLQAKCHL